MSAKIKLFCFPHAGGLSSVYKSWERYISNDIEIIPIELAGRGKRIDVPTYQSIDEAVDDLYKNIESHLDMTEFALFGHSLGAIIVYEMIYKLKKELGREPIHTFFSGRMPIQIVSSRDRHKLSDKALRDYIIKLGGTPVEIQQYDELLNMFLPIIRSDFKMVETYNYKPKYELMKSDISIFNGKNDELIDKDRLEGWKDYTTGACEFYKFEGGHFYINDSQREVVNEINNILLSVQFLQPKYINVK